MSDLEKLKTEVRPDYTTLQGYLAQIQRKEGNLGLEYDEVASEYQTQLKKIIDRLTEMTGNDYSEFEIPIHRAGGNGMSVYQKIEMEVYAVKMSGLILRLYGQFFYDEANPLDGTPSTIINSSQSQSQQVDVKLVIDVSGKIQEALTKTKDPTEKSFLEKMKSKLETVKDYADLMKLTASTANDVGLAVDKAISLIA